MALSVGDAVELKNSGTSVAGGVTIRMEPGLVGRICRMTPFGFCNVQFEEIGCRRVHRRRLIQTNRPAPQCEPHCTGS